MNGQPFYALIIPQSAGVPTHPIAPGGPPLGTWGGAGQPFPTPPIHMPPVSPGVPTHPIYYPPGIWGPTDPRPGWGLPGQPPGTWGGSGQPFPTPPIVIPPEKPGDPPLVIWGGGNQPFPTPPIELPGGEPPPDKPEPPQKLVEWRTAWTPTTGWIIVGVPQVPVPGPSKK